MSICLGIDLGTSNSCIAVYKEGKQPEIIEINGDRYIPSCVSISKDTFCVGKSAKAQMYNDFDGVNVITETKRIIGRKFTDKHVKAEREQTTLNIVEDEREMAAIQLDVKNKPEIITPE